MVEYKGSLYLFGGYNGSQWLNDFHGFHIGEACLFLYSYYPGTFVVCVSPFCFEFFCVTKPFCLEFLFNFVYGRLKRSLKRNVIPVPSYAV